MKASFQYNGATLHVVAPSPQSRMREWWLKNTVGFDAIPPGPFRYATAFSLVLLSRTCQIEGHLIPDLADAQHALIENPTATTIQAFLDWFLMDGQDVELLEQWEAALVKAKQAANDPDLLPAEKIDPNA